MNRRLDSPAAGLAAMMCAMAVFPFMDALSKTLSDTYAPEQITWARNLVHAALILPLVLVRIGWREVVGGLSGLQVARGLAFVLMTSSYIAGLRWMPLADGMAIVFLFPLIVTGLSGIFLGETVGVRRWAAVVVAFLGVCLILRPGFGVLNAGAPFLLAAALLAAFYVLLTRKLAGTVSSLVQLLLPAVIGAVALSVVVPFSWVTPTWDDAALMVFIGALGAGGHLMMILAYERAEASLAVPLITGIGSFVTCSKTTG